MKIIDIIGDIVDDDDIGYYERCHYSAVCPKKIKTLLSEADGDDIEININSGGGSVFAGFDIYSAIRGYKGNVRINVTGLAASAASVIMCAAESFISPVGTVMLHCSSCMAWGNHNDLEKTAEALKTIDENIANAYIEKSGMTKSRAISLLEATSWLSAEKVLEMGLCDGYIQRVNASVQAGEKSSDSKKNDKAAAAKAKARFLTMKGENSNV